MITYYRLLCQWGVLVDHPSTSLATVRGFAKSSLLPNNKEGVSEVRYRTHSQEISEFSGPQEGVVTHVSPSERVVTDKRHRALQRISGSTYKDFEFAQREFAVVAVV